MEKLEELEEKARQLGLIVDYAILRESDGLDGLYLAWPDGAVILINAHRPASTQAVALAEEIGHHLRTVGRVVGQNTVADRKGEARGRAWSYVELMPPEMVRKAVSSGIRQPWELAELFGVPDGFVKEAIGYYRRKEAL